MSKVSMGLVVLSVMVCPGLAQAQQKVVDTTEAVQLEPLVVTPQTAAIEEMSQFIAAQLIQEQHWELPELQAPQAT